MILRTYSILSSVNARQFLFTLAIFISGLPFPAIVAAQSKIKLYVLDGGILENVDPERFGLKNEEVTTRRLPVPVFLIVHPKGTLLWDAGAVPDSAWKFTGSSASYRVVYQDINREVTLMKPLQTQLREVGYPSDKINFLALSHYHYDHTGNANAFSTATWLVNKGEYEAMFSPQPPKVTWPVTYSALRKSHIRFLTTDEHDVFGDGTVIIKSAPGHTPGHLVLFVKLNKTGGVVLSGDLYHYAEERTLTRFPTFEYDKEQTRIARENIDAFLKRKKAQLWIQHDLSENLKLKKAPDYYE